jgi:hypothetical protein
MSEAPPRPDASADHAPKLHDGVSHRPLLARLFGPPAWKVRLREAHLPEPAAGVVRGVCVKAKLWKGETDDVARELCAHFRDGLDAGRSAEQLTRDFGDPAQVAKLIRRSKKRNRPLAWRMYAWSLRGIVSLLILGVLFYGYGAARLYAARPSIARNFSKEYNDKILARGSDRAWPIYRAAIIATPNLPWKNGDWPGNWPDVRPEDEGYEQALQYLRDCGPLLAEIRRGAKLPIIGIELSDANDVEVSAAIARRRGHTMPLTPDVPSENPDMIGVLLPHLGPMREFARLLLFDTRQAMKSGDGTRVVANIDAMLGMAHQLGEEPFLISELVGYAILTLASQETSRVLRDAPQMLSDESLVLLAHRLATCIKPGRLIPVAGGERWMFDDAVQRMFSDDGSGDGRITATGLKLLEEYAGLSAQYAGGLLSERTLYRAAGPVLGQVMAGRRATQQEYDRVIGQIEAWASQSPWVRRTTLDAWSLEYNAKFDDLGWRSRYALITVLVPALNRAYWTGDTTTLEREATATALACEVFRRRAGRWPTGLQELVPGLLPSMPLDIFDGKPLRYQVIEGRGAVLYSIGNNLVDDGGMEPQREAYFGSMTPERPGEKGDWIFFPRATDVPRKPKEPVVVPE